ncbi:hypothetical protein [uncultured Ruegeria sp.]|uniref:hypothetical protein n=1 Tax=uncultured Ruegeria sp. TaxID=259304 RepID=UPI0026130934|nr:hypothetical protein [uncultured Ruegeria sp.]
MAQAPTSEKTPAGASGLGGKKKPPTGDPVENAIEESRAAAKEAFKDQLDAQAAAAKLIWVEAEQQYAVDMVQAQLKAQATKAAAAAATLETAPLVTQAGHTLTKAEADNSTAQGALDGLYKAQLAQEQAVTEANTALSKAQKALAQAQFDLDAATNDYQSAVSDAATTASALASAKSANADALAQQKQAEASQADAEKTADAQLVVDTETAEATKTAAWATYKKALADIATKLAENE